MGGIPKMLFYFIFSIQMYIIQIIRSYLNYKERFSRLANFFGSFSKFVKFFEVSGELTAQ